MAPLAFPVGGTATTVVFVLLVCPFVVASALIMFAHATDRLRVSREAELGRLADLYRQGALSDQEFSEAKHRLSRGHPASIRPAPTQPV